MPDESANRLHVEYFSQANADIPGHFGEVFLSSTIGLRTPDAAAYDHVVRAIGVPALRIVFFDETRQCGCNDRPINCSHDHFPVGLALAHRLRNAEINRGANNRGDEKCHLRS